MMRAIALLGLALAGAGLWLAPETVSIMGENIEPVRYERAAAAVPMSACTTSVPIANGSSGIPVYTVCSVGSGGGGSTWSTSATSVTGR